MGEVITHGGELVDHFLNFCCPQGRKKIGVEFEKLGVFAHSGKAILYTGERGVADVLSGLSQRFGWKLIKEDDNIIGLSRRAAQITLEPGGQIELSGSPSNDIHQIKKELENHLTEIKSVSDSLDIKWLGLGIQPVSSLEEIQWVPKQRYRIMAPYMAKYGKLSQYMMKKTASIQVSVDYSNEEDFANKMYTALVLAPIITAIFSNSPISEGKINGFLSERAHIWNHTDPARCGLIEERFFCNPGFSSYIDYALKVPMLFIVRDNRWIEVKNTTFSWYLKNGYKGYKANIDDWNLHLSTIFTEVRARNCYIEIRCADCQRMPLALAVVALWKGIVYSKEAMRAVRFLVKNLSWEELCQLYFAVPRKGLKTRLRGVRLLELAKELLRISYSGLKEQRCFNQKGEDESIYLDPVMQLVIEDEVCPAEIIITNWNGSWHKSIDKLIDYTSY